MHCRKLVPRLYQESSTSFSNTELILSEMVLVKLSTTLSSADASSRIPSLFPFFQIQCTTHYSSYVYIRTYNFTSTPVLFLHHAVGEIESLHSSLRPPTKRTAGGGLNICCVCCLRVSEETKSEPEAGSQLVGSGSAASELRAEGMFSKLSGQGETPLTVLPL